jgi:hypothetical protein
MVPAKLLVEEDVATSPMGMIGSGCGLNVCHRGAARSCGKLTVKMFEVDVLSVSQRQPPGWLAKAG